ncbi:preprotein translocase subunit SecA [Candidatus Parcubacteria bacterium]|nr:preprotein translocase subunit SecA [Candidatus Parcubacteria bacterium]
MSIINKILGDPNKKLLKSYYNRLPKINDLSEEISALTDQELKQKTTEFKERLSKGESLDDILPEAFAVVREASSRTLNERHYDVQLIGGMAIHDGNISEMRTGEGKTLVATLPAYLNALSGKGVHVVTVNDYLARRDAVWMGQVYDFLGMTISIINQGASYIYDPTHETSENDEERDEQGSYRIVYDFLRPITRPEAYQADITYGTNSEFGFDYLRDNIEYEKENLRQGRNYFAIIDEIDSILIDEARTPLIISAPSTEAENLYEVFAKIARKLEPETDYTVDEKLKAISLTDSGITKAEKLLNVDNIYTEKGIKYVHHLETAVRAKALFNLDKHYVVKDNAVVIVDEFTGRLQPSRRWSEGLHQAVEAKEGLKVGQESKTFASITYQNFFKMYEKLSGMTGTAETSSEEFFKVYKLNVVIIPTNKPVQRIDHHDLIYQTEKGKWMALTRKIKEIHEKGQPILIGTASIDKNEQLSNFLNQEGISHDILNAKNHEREAEIIANAGKKGAVTIATNMAGRGVDIKLGGVPTDKEKSDEIRELGGLFVIGTERHEARRIDNQLRGRSGRQGDPGETQFFVSMEDTLMRVFAPDSLKGIMKRLGLPEDQPIQNKMISRSLESAQTKIEGFHFDARKHILEFDNVLNSQRDSIYERRRKILMMDDEQIEKEVAEIIERGGEKIEKEIQNKKEILGEEEWKKTIKRLLLQTIDTLWIDHLEIMDYTRSSVNLRAYGQRDPLIEYKKEGLRLFKELKESIYEQAIKVLPNIGAGAFQKEEERLKANAKKAQMISGKRDSSDAGAPKNVISEPKIGRNEKVVIVKDGVEKEMKYKKAESLLAEGWQIKK